MKVAGILLLTLQLFFQGLGQSRLVEITSPRQNEAVRGMVTITGSARVNGFSSYEILYNYEKKKSDNWFLITSGNEMVIEDTLANWDTSTIADGDYRLRIRVLSKSGEETTATIDHVRIRNYTPVETLEPSATPKPVIKIITATQSGAQLIQTNPDIESATLTAKTPTPEGIPDNPVKMELPDFTRSLVYGALATVLLFLLLLFYKIIKNIKR